MTWIFLEESLMKLYTSIGPNPRVVHIFMAEKGIELPTVQVDIMGGENRQTEHLARNPAGQMPTLELDDGSFLAEITAICEYLEEVYPAPPLIGETPEARAATRMWCRRVDLNICEPMTNAFRSSEGLGLFKDRVHTIPQAADDLKEIAQEKLAWVDDLMGDAEWLVGDRLTLSDIHLYAFLEFGGSVGQPLDPGLKNLTAWYERMSARPSIEASRS